MPKDDNTVHYEGPSGGWGSVRGMARIYARELSPPTVLKTLSEQNKPEGFACVSCAWAKPPTTTRRSSARTAPRRRCGK